MAKQFDFSKFIDNVMEKTLKENAMAAYKDMIEISHSVIEEFYNDYSPAQYQRVWGFIGGGNYLYKPSIKKIKDGYRVEFIYSDEYMTGEHRSTEWAFDTGFLHGMHGGRFAWGHEESNIPYTNPSPYNQILNFVCDPKTLERYGKIRY